MSDGESNLENSSLKAWKSPASNPVGRWSRKSDSGRDAESRVKKGFVIPEVTPSFSINLDRPIFTIGSCFARNIEDALMAEGADLPTKRVVSPFAAAKGVRPNSVLNKYNIPSIAQELAWASEGDRGFGKDLLLESGESHLDPHVHELVSTGPIEELLHQHSNVTEAFSQIRGCESIIMTLGMTEIWYDKACEVYLNAAPSGASIKKTPDRFAFRILSYEENRLHLEKCIQIIFSNAAPNARLILTVSPVALKATFNDRDVMVANSQSKATLVALAQTTSASYSNVDYFPSFEAVMWSDPLFAWQPDRRHVSPAMVNSIVAEFLYRYAGKPKPVWPSFQDNRAQNIVDELQLANKLLAKKLSTAQAG